MYLYGIGQLHPCGVVEQMNRIIFTRGALGEYIHSLSSFCWFGSSFMLSRDSTLAVILNWLFLKSHGSVIPVMLLHGAANNIDNFVPMPMVVLSGFGTSTVLRGMVYWVMAIVIIIFTRGWLGADSNNTHKKTLFYT